MGVLLFARAQNPNIDAILAAANESLRLFPQLREDREQADHINIIIPGYGLEIARDNNYQILVNEQLVLHALGTVLPTAGNVLTARAYYKILMQLEKVMAEGRLHMVSHKQEYACILLHLKEALEVLPSENPHYNSNFSNPLYYDECVHELRRDILHGFRIKQSDAVVYVWKEVGPYKEFLQSLADYLTG